MADHLLQKPNTGQWLLLLLSPQSLSVNVAKYTDQRYSNILTQIQLHKLKTIQGTN